MRATKNPNTVRRPRAIITQLTTNYLHLRSPAVVAFFSLSYPGFGNLLQQRFVKAFVLIIWELFINQKAHLNLGIMYSMQGQFEKAKAIVDERWLLLYIGIYVFSIWNSYRGTIEINKLVMLADREAAPIPFMKLGPWSYNFLDKHNPVLALLWSALVPGLGQLYLHKVVTGLFLFFYSIIIIAYSHVPLAIHYTWTGHFDMAKAAIDMQWFLYIPSIYSFVLYDSYASAVELNKLFEKEQSAHLQAQHQPSTFPMPI